MRNASRRAWTRLDLIVLTSVTVLLLCLGVLWILDARAKARSICCNCNLKQIGLAFKIWSSDHFGKFPMQVSVTNGGTMELVMNGNVFPHFLAMSNELSTPFILVCPEDRAKRPLKEFTTNFDDSRISYFVGLDAVDSNPQMFLSGDSNITNGFEPQHKVLDLITNQSIGWTEKRHGAQGNIGFADGSVQQFKNSGLNQALLDSGVTTNRIAIP